MSGVPGPAASEFDFHTERLHLRPLDERDEALFHALYTDPETMCFIAPPLTVERAAESFRKIVLHQREPSLEKRFLAILDKATSRPIGICGTSHYDAVALRLEVGAVLKPETHSQHFAREALAALMKKIFDISPVEEIQVRFSSQNPAARGLSIHLGFMPCDKEMSQEGSLPRLVWSVHRSSWRMN